MEKIETSRLVLRRPLPEDVLLLAEINADPEVMKYIGDGRVRTFEHTAEGIRRAIRGWDEHGYGMFSVDRRDTGEYIGWVTLAVPSFLPEVLPAIEHAGLLVCDVEIMRLHYAETLKAWRQRFMARRDEVVRLYDERFARMWEFYLAASEMAFRKQNLMNFQIQLTKRQGVVPMTRDYIAGAEARLRGREPTSRPRLKIAGG